MLCGCGCGQDAGVYGNSYPKLGIVKGQPKKFVRFHRAKKTHCKRGHELTTDNRVDDGSCKTCRNIRSTEYRLANPEKFRAFVNKSAAKHRDKINQKHREYRRNSPDAVLDTKLRTRYGLSLVEYKAMLAFQDNKCKICGAEFEGKCKPEVDHCHATEKVRGLLCHYCNVMLGQAKDNAETLANAIIYLNAVTNQQTTTS